MLAFISETWPSVTYPMMFGVGVGAALTSLVVVVAAHRLNPHVGSPTCALSRSSLR